MSDFQKKNSEMAAKSAPKETDFYENLDEIDSVSERLTSDPVFKKHYAEAAEEALNVTYRESRILLRKPEDIATSVRHILMDLPPRADNLTLDAIRKALSDIDQIKDDFDLQVTKSKSLIYSALKDFVNLRVEAGEAENVACNTFGVSSATVDGMICFKLPYLDRKLLSGNRTGTRFHYSKLYGREVALLAQRELGKMIPNVEDFRVKTVSYFFIKGIHDSSEPLDADNHDTKHITDSILNIFPGADASWGCSFWYEELDPTPWIKENATVVIVKKGKNSVASAEDFEKVSRVLFNEPNGMDDTK